MRKLLLAIAIVCFATMAYADTTGDAVFRSPNGTFDSWAEVFNDNQDYMTHNHSYNVPDERDDPLGIEAEVVMWENENPDGAFEEIRIDVSHDFENDETGGFLVFRFNLFSWLTGE